MHLILILIMNACLIVYGLYLFHIYCLLVLRLYTILNNYNLLSIFNKAISSSCLIKKITALIKPMINKLKSTVLINSQNIRQNQISSCNQS